MIDRGAVSSWCIPGREKVAPAEPVYSASLGGCHAFLAVRGMHHDDTAPLFRIIQFARAHRKTPTRSEALLWAQLRKRKLGVRFRRQHVFSLGLVVDFYAPALKLVVEVDGTVHDAPGAAERDAARQALIESKYGVRFLRIRAELVERDVLGAVEIVRRALP